MDNAKILEHGLRQVYAVVFTEVFAHGVADHHILALLVNLNIELVSLLCHGREHNCLTKFMHIHHLAWLPLLQVLRVLLKNLAAVNSTLDQLLIHVNLIDFLEVAGASFDLSAQLLFAVLED